MSKVIKGMVIFALVCFTSVQVLGLENEPLITLTSSGVMICFKQGATIEVRNMQKGCLFVWAPMIDEPCHIPTASAPTECVFTRVLGHALQRIAMRCGEGNLPDAFGCAAAGAQ